MYSGIVLYGEGGISAPYLYIKDKKESDWLPVTASTAAAVVSTMTVAAGVEVCIYALN